MNWARPELLWLIPGVCLATVVSHLLRGRRRRRVVEALGAPLLPAMEIVRTGLVMAALALVAVALCGPGGTRATPRPPGAGGDVVLLLDVSRSMATRDVTPDRGAVARLAALRIATAAGAGRVGVAAFAADAYLMVPPTEDRGLVALYVESLDPGAVTGQGSDLARALGVAVSAVKGGSVVLVSDGEGFQDEDSLKQALQAARAAGVVVHTVLSGTPSGGEVPGALTGGRSSARPDVRGDVARATGGISVDGRDGPSVARLVKILSGRGPMSAPEEGGTSRVPWIALAALAFLLTESALAARRSPGAL